MIDTFLLAQLAIGFSVGMTYAVVAIGFTLIYRVLTAVNFAHGEVYTLGAFTVLVGATALQIPLWCILPIVILVGAAAGWGIELAGFRLFRRFADEASLKSRAVREATLEEIGAGTLGTGFFRMQVEGPDAGDEPPAPRTLH